MNNQVAQTPPPVEKQRKITSAQTRVPELPLKKIFQAESFDRIIRNDEEFHEKMNYILYNPVKKGLIENAYEYKWYYYSQEI